MRKQHRSFATGTSAGYRLDGFLQALRERSMSPRFALSVSLLVFAVTVLLSEALLHFREAEFLSQREAAATGFASELRARVDRELNSVLYLASGIVGYLVVRHDRLDAKEVSRILGAIHTFGRHVRNFSIAVDYRITYVFPLKGNEQALNVDYRDIPAQWPTIRKTIDSGESVLTGPVSLLQGGSALIYRIPVHVDGKYWGLLSTVIDMTSFQNVIDPRTCNSPSRSQMQARRFSRAFGRIGTRFTTPLRTWAPGGRWTSTFLRTRSYRSPH